MENSKKILINNLLDEILNSNLKLMARFVKDYCSWSDPGESFTIEKLIGDLNDGFADKEAEKENKFLLKLLNDNFSKDTIIIIDK